MTGLQVKSIAIAKQQELKSSGGKTETQAGVAAMASLSLSTASLRSSSYFSSDFQVKNGRIAARFHRGRCVAQMALPELLNG